VHIHSSILTRADLNAIAAGLGMELRNGSGDSVLLRPLPSMDETYRVIGSRNRRVWAVTWEGHYAFMAQVFERDPRASIRSTLAHWRDREHFLAEAKTPPRRHGHVTQSPMNWSPQRWAEENAEQVASAALESSR